MESNFNKVYEAHQTNKYEIFNKWCEENGIR